MKLNMGRSLIVKNKIKQEILIFFIFFMEVCISYKRSVLEGTRFFPKIKPTHQKNKNKIKPCTGIILGFGHFSI